MAFPSTGPSRSLHIINSQVLAMLPSFWPTSLLSFLTDPDDTRSCFRYHFPWLLQLKTRHPITLLLQYPSSCYHQHWSSPNILYLFLFWYLILSSLFCLFCLSFMQVEGLVWGLASVTLGPRRIPSDTEWIIKILLCSDLPCKAWQTKWINQQKFIIFTFLGLEIWDQDVSMLFFSWGHSPGLADDLISQNPFR